MLNVRREALGRQRQWTPFEQNVMAPAALGFSPPFVAESIDAVVMVTDDVYGSFAHRLVSTVAFILARRAHSALTTINFRDFRWPVHEAHTEEEDFLSFTCALIAR